MQRRLPVAVAAVVLTWLAAPSAQGLKAIGGFLVPNESNDISWRFGSLPPAPGSNRSLESAPSICPCNQALISSLGQAQHVQSDSMGVYKYYTQFNGHPAYSGPGGKRLYFLVGSGWLLGPAVGSPQGFIHNANAYLCPYLIPTGWMFVNSGYWYDDATLVVRCIA